MKKYPNANSLEQFFDKYKERVQKLIATKGSIPECRDGKFNFWLYKYYIEYCLTVVFLFCCF